MKTLEWIADTEVNVISMIKFIGDFEVTCNTPKCISIKVFSNNNAVTIQNTLIDDCDINCINHLVDNFTSEKASDSDYVKFMLNKDCDMNFSVTYKDGYTTVAIILEKEVMRIG